MDYLHTNAAPVSTFDWSLSMKALGKSALLVFLASAPLWALASGDDRLADQRIASELGLIDRAKAEAIALQARPGVVREIELDDRSFGRGWKWEVEVINAQGEEFELDIDASSGEVLNNRKDWF